MLRSQLMPAEAKISPAVALLRIAISCINNTQNHIHNNIVSNTVPIIPYVRTLHYLLHQPSFRAESQALILAFKVNELKRGGRGSPAEQGARRTAPVSLVITK